MQKFSFGHEPFSKQCPWFTSFPFACDIGAYNWMTFCTHKKVTMGSPFMQKILLCRKFIYVENSFMHKILLCRKSIYAENSFMQINSFMQKNSFYAEKSLYAEKFLYAEKISFRHKPFTKQCPWLTIFSCACDIGTYNWMTFCTNKNNTYNWTNHN